MDFGSGPRPRRFWYFFTDLSFGYANRSKLGSWIWDRQAGQVTGEYANQPSPAPTWFNGNKDDMPADVPCRTCPDTCGVMSGWPTFTRTDIHVTQASGPGVWDYTDVPIASQDADLVVTARTVDGEPYITATFNREFCVATVLGFDGVPSPGSHFIEPGITDPAYVFTTQATSFVIVTLTSIPLTTIAVFWRVRWYADP